jgi:uncharacterized cupin superfamily protein
MSEKTPIPQPLTATTVSATMGQTNYPESFASLVAGRLKRKLGDVFGLTQFGVNLTQLAPGAISALFHAHSQQDEFIFILEGNPTLLVGDREFSLQTGECYGFKAGTGIAHQLINRSQGTVTYLEIGTRSAGDQVDYPCDDLKAVLLEDGGWQMTHKDGTKY